MIVEMIFLFLYIFCQIIYVDGISGNCIKVVGPNSSELPILNTVNESTCITIYDETSDNQTVIRNLQVKKTCARESDVRVMALVFGKYDCVMQEFLFTRQDKSGCSMERRCQSKKGIPYGSNSTLCLLKCPKDEWSDEAFGVQLILPSKQRNVELCGLQTYQVDWIQPDGWTGPETIFYRSFDTPDGLTLIEGTQEKKSDVLVSGLINSAVATGRTRKQWIDLGIHTEACMTRPETCGAAGGAVSFWLRLNDCPDWAGIISSHGSSTGFIFYCRNNASEHLRFHVRLQDGTFTLYNIRRPIGWTYVLLNYLGPKNGQGIRLFYNEEGERGDSSREDASLTSSGDGRIVVGRHHTDRDQAYASVEVDELVFFNRYLNNEEVRKLHNAI